MPDRIEDTDAPQGKLNTIEKTMMEGDVIEAIRTVYDPEIPVNVYDLGLIYDVTVSDDREVDIKMTLTSPTCPVAETLPVEVEVMAAAVKGVKSAKVEMVWDPPFTLERIPEHIRLEMGLF